MAGFLFNGGLAGLRSSSKRFHFADYQAEQDRLEEHPAGDVRDATRIALRDSRPGCSSFCIGGGNIIRLPHDDGRLARRGLLPWWVEWSLYATMPLFHVHTFLALSIVLGFWLLIGTWEMRKQIAILLAAAFIPATWIVWMITDHFQAKSILAWAPGWVKATRGSRFPRSNFGLSKYRRRSVFGCGTLA